MIAGGEVRKRNHALTRGDRRRKALSSNSIGSVKELIAVECFAP
jgi:hypothetical protein